jgi:phenylacetate-CoA ligase
VLARVSEEFRELSKNALDLYFLVGGSDTLTPMMKRRISDAFGAPVYDTYASEEIDIMAWECKESGQYHVCDDNVILEVLKDGVPAAPGERGEVVATNLHLYAMPFIRYRVGDEVTVGEQVCPCGLPFSTIKAIDGRKTDYLILPGKRELFAASIAYILQREAPWINKYELVQEKENRVVLRVVADAYPPPDVLDPLFAKIQALLGHDVVFLIEHVRELQPGPGGKYRILRSLISSPYA